MEVDKKNVEVARLFFEINKTIRNEVRKCFEEIGITMEQSMVIVSLIKHGEMKITELSNMVNLSNSTMTGMIDRLEKQKMVVRTRSEEDRRSVFVKVTPEVEKIHEDIHRKIEESFGILLSAGKPEDIDKVLEGLNALKKILNERRG